MQDIFKRLQDTDRKCRAKAAELAILNRKKGDWVGIGFRVGDIRLLSKMGEVTEILDMPEFTRVPGAKPWVVGIANVRGSLLPLMDIQGFVTGEALKNRKDGRVLVANLRGTHTGLVVSEILGLRHFSLDEQAYELPEIANAFKPFIKQAFHREQDYWPVFSLQTLIEDDRFLQAAL
ncbi:MAG: chemotaxis protein CheW [Gammaproteobacteria bacterium]|jgi:twitching motility protein PilI|nr:chemotaxis protein CheW [Gammaproteobacteria bacterium]HEX5638007.1 chemotaxis protein CheW [Gammaproteobacteria bacterium]